MNIVTAVETCSLSSDITSTCDITTILSSSEDILLPEGTYYIKSNITIPEKKLSFLKDAKISVETGNTLTFNNTEIVAPDNQQIFSGNGTITGVVSSSFVSVDWFGAVGDSITDDSSAIQKAANLAKYANSKLLYIPNKTYYFDKNIYIYSSVNCDGKLIKKITIDPSKTDSDDYLFDYYPVTDAKVIIPYSRIYSLTPSQFGEIEEGDSSILSYSNASIISGGTIDLSVGGTLVLKDSDFFISRNNGAGDEFYTKNDCCQIVIKKGHVFPEFCFAYKNYNIDSIRAYSDSTVYTKGDYVKIGTTIYKCVYPCGPDTIIIDPFHGMAKIGPKSPDDGTLVAITYPDKKTDFIQIWQIVNRTVYYCPPEIPLNINGLKIEVRNNEIDRVKRRTNSASLLVYRSNVTFNDCSIICNDTDLLLSSLVNINNVANIEFNRCYMSGATYPGLGYNFLISNSANIRLNDCESVNCRNGYGARHGKNVYFNRGHYWKIDEHYGRNYFLKDVHLEAKTVSIPDYNTPAANIDKFKITSGYACSFAGGNISISGGKVSNLNATGLFACRSDTPDLYGEIILSNITFEGIKPFYLAYLSYNSTFNFMRKIRTPSHFAMDNIQAKECRLILKADINPRRSDKINVVVSNCSSISDVTSENAIINFIRCNFNGTTFMPDTTSTIDFIECNFSGTISGLMGV